MAGWFFSGSGNSISATWDGKDASGKQVAPGTYTATLAAQTSGGTCSGGDSDIKTFPITVKSTKEDPCLNAGFESSVNTASGNLRHSQSLFNLPNSKILGDFSLTYNSLDAYNQILGIGWTHSCNINLSQNSGGSYTLIEGDGNRLVLYSNGSVYTPETSTYPILTMNGGTSTLKHKDGIVYTFNQNGKITSITDRNSNAVSFTYDGNNNLTGIIDTAGRSITLTYNGSRLNTISNPSGNTHSFTYSDNKLTGVSSQIAGVGTSNWSYTYDANGFMLTKIDPLGKVTSYTYDTNHKVSQVTDPEGRTRALTYNPAASSTQFTEKDGGVWTYKYNSSAGVLNELTDSLNNKTTYTYDSNRNLISITDPRNKVTSYTYDANANVTSVTDALSNATTYTYNAINKVTGIVYPGNATVTFTYDSNGNLTSLTDPMNNLTQYAYDAKGNLTGITDPLNRTTILAYNLSNYLTSITEPNGAVTSFTYDTAGNMIGHTNPQNNLTSFEYNGLNKIKKVTDPQSNIITYTYDLMGNMPSTNDANGKNTLYEYNYKGQVKKITDALNNITQFAYGSGCPSCGTGVDRLTSIIDARGKVTIFEYDLAGRLIKETDPLSYFKSYSYDAAGNRISRTDEDGAVIQYAYDNINRLTQISYPNSTTTTFGYNVRGNMTSAANPDIGYSFTYDLNNRLTGILDSNNKTISYQYNGLNQRTQMITPDGRTITYGYNTGNRLSQITSPAGVFNLSYDNAGRRTTLSYPNGVTTTYSYNPSSFLTSLLARNFQQVIINSYSYTHDNMGNRISMTDPSGVHNYAYDNTYQLTQATHPNMPNEQFGYDAVGNRTTSEGQPPALGTTTNYAYDFENRLIEVDYISTLAQYKYDPFGRRIEKNLNGEITRYVYDGADIVTEFDQNWNVRSEYTYHLAIDDPLAVEQGTNTFYYHKDGLGSITEMTDASGNMIKSYRYKSFGEIHSETGTLAQPFTFTGREYDPESGLYYYRARYYDPRAGRFLTKDPIGFASGDVNLYRAMRNNPLNRRDPLGLYEIDVHLHLTYKLALQVGIDPDTAWKIAWANQSMDENATRPDFLWGWLTVIGWKSHFRTKDYAQRCLSQSVDMKNPNLLGNFLHILQDSFSHGDLPLGPISHAALGHQPDFFSYDNPRDRKMIDLTLWWLQEFKNIYSPITRKGQ